MTLQEIRELEPDYQMVLAFSNNNKVVITNDDFLPNSRFIRRSKKRLNMIFYNIVDSNDIKVYRTYRGSDLCDYIVFLANDYQIIESYRKNNSHGSLIRNTNKSNNKLPKSDKDYTIQVRFTDVDKTKFYWTVEHPNIYPPHNPWVSSIYDIKPNPDWFMVYAKVLVALTVLSKENQCKHYNRVSIHLNKGEEGVSKLVNGKWKARVPLTKYYRDTMLYLKDELRNNNVSIIFRYE